MFRLLWTISTIVAMAAGSEECSVILYEWFEASGRVENYGVGEYPVIGILNNLVSAIEVLGPHCEATAYADDNFGGWAVTLGQGKYLLEDLEALGFKNEQMSSLKVRLRTSKVCIDVRKKKACKELTYCLYDRNSSPMCTDVMSDERIPIKKFCEVIPTRGWCKRVEECFWTGEECLLKSEASCTDIMKRRICQPLRSSNGGCLNGKHCFWTGQYCIETRGASC